MGFSKQMRKAHDLAKDLYLSGMTDCRELAVHLQVPVQTIYRWAKAGGWGNLKKNELTLDVQIKIMSKKALLSGLEQYTADPKNSDLKTVIELLKDYQKKIEPARELNFYIITFLDQIIEYCHTKGLDDLGTHLQEQIHDMAEWFRARNNG